VGTDGSIDPNFNPSLNQLTDTVTVLSNQHILVGGAFTTVQGSGGAPLTFVDHVTILNPDGSIDPSFSLGAGTAPTGQVRTFAQQPNGQVIFAGSFSPIDGSTAAYISRLNGDATIDTSFNSGTDGPVNSVAVLPSGASTVIPSNSGVWLNPSGSVRYTYSAATNGEVICSVQQADGKVVIGGLFSTFAGVSGLQNLVRLNTDGTVDTSFSPSVTGAVNAIAIQPADGKIVIGGGFTSVSGVNNTYIARLNTDGSVDTAFSPSPNLEVLSLLILSSGQILVGGDFSQRLPNAATTVVSINFLARLNTDGTVDTSFNPDPSGPIYCIGVNSSGQYIVGGSFSSFTPNLGTTVYNLENLARLNPNGIPDTGFYPDPDSPVVTLLVLLTARSSRADRSRHGSRTRTSRVRRIPRSRPGPSSRATTSLASTRTGPLTPRLPRTRTAPSARSPSSRTERSCWADRSLPSSRTGPAFRRIAATSPGSMPTAQSTFLSIRRSMVTRTRSTSSLTARSSSAAISRRSRWAARR